MSTAEQTPPDNVVALTALANARQGAERDKAAYTVTSQAQKDAEKLAQREAAREHITATAGAYEAQRHGDLANLPPDPRSVPGWQYGFARVYGWPRIHVESATSLADELPLLFAAGSAHLSGVGGSVFVHDGRLVSYLGTGGHLSTDKRLTDVSPDLAAKIAADQALCYVVVRLEPQAMMNPDMIDTVAADPDFLGWEGEPGGGAYRKRVAPGSALFRPYLADTRYPGVRTLRELVRRPVLDWAGRVVAAPGYDPVSGLLVDTTEGEVPYPVPEAPGQPMVQAAAAELGKLFGDFPWRDNASYANWLAMALSVVGRRAFAGEAGRFLAVPGLVIRAGAADAGKSTLSRMLGNLHGHAEVAWPRDSKRSGGDAEAELEKRVITAYLERPDAPVMLIDNIANAVLVESEMLAKAVLSPMITGRKLRSSESINVPNHMLVVLNGNQIKLTADLTSRYMLVELDNPTPAQRRAPKYRPNLPSEVDSPEFQLLVLALLQTIVRGWVTAGRPGAAYPAGVRDNFTPWARQLSGVLAYAGVAGFLANWEELAEQDEDPALPLMASLRDLFPAGAAFTAADLVNAALPDLESSMMAGPFTQVERTDRERARDYVAARILERCKAPVMGKPVSSRVACQQAGYLLSPLAGKTAETVGARLTVRRVRLPGAPKRDVARYAVTTTTLD
jgi:hypothetical protein